jgi:hypothetical protein
MGFTKFKLPSQQTQPPYLQAAGRELWASTLREWDLADAHLVVLTTACECTDRLVQIRAAMDADGSVLTELSGRKHSHPLIAAEQ